MQNVVGIEDRASVDIYAIISCCISRGYNNLNWRRVHGSGGVYERVSTNISAEEADICESEYQSRSTWITYCT